jgi:3-hydroxyacyl-CoA dehydrogenase
MSTTGSSLGAEQFRQVAVLGAGVMGAQIAAHFVNAGVPCTLFDLAAKDGDKNGVVRKAIAGLLKLQPAPFGAKENADLIRVANYDENIELLAECDLVIEAISERMDWKKDLYAKVIPPLQRAVKNGRNVVMATNTSGLSIQSLAEVLPADFRSRFCGIHFFNPPRYMQLVELIPHSTTAPALLDRLETFVTSTLGKGVVRAKDTPNFIANRVGVFSILSVMKRAEQFGLGFDIVDGLTGPLIGRPKSATYRTADVVGLDTLGHVVGNMQDTLKSDPWKALYQVPEWLKGLIAKGAIGQKAGAGIFKKEGKEILVFDPAAASYRATAKDVPEEIVAILKIKNPAEKLAKLRSHSSNEAKFLWAIFSDIFHYSAVLLGDIAHSARDIDWCMRWGYGWTHGPFETWQASGWATVAQWVAEDIASGKALASVALPKWAVDPARTGVHSETGSFAPESSSILPRSSLPVYKRQPYPESLVGERHTYGETVFENAGVRLWTTGDDLGVLSFKSKMHAVGDAVLDGCLESVERASKAFKGLVIWQTEQPFCAGANLQELVEAVGAGKISQVSSMVKRFQKTSQAFKYSQVPVIAAPTGLALGGGCEFLMHATTVTASLETYAGLVEVGVGLLPAGGGCKEFAVRAVRKAGVAGITAELKQGFENMAMAKVSTSATDAKNLGYFRPSDIVVFHPNETLYIAKKTALHLFESMYRPPIPGQAFPVAGSPGIATLEMMLVNMLEGHFISEHDYNIGKRMATILCGGAVDEGTLVDEDWLLELEHKHFMELCETTKTQERVMFMLKNGKPLRN